MQPYSQTKVFPSQNSQPNMPSTSKKSYAAATSDIFSKKDQGILIDVVDGIELKDYITAVGKIVDKADIRFASRISNGRICLFLSSKEIVKDLTDKHKTVMIGQQQLEIRPLMNPLKRIILSNVSPVIPHEILENELQRKGIKIASQISFLRVGISDEGFSHVLSFRRHIFINPEDIDKLPESMVIFLEDTTYRIFIASKKHDLFYL